MRILLLTILALAMLQGSALASGAEVYAKHCASCHHGQRWGLIGPPLLPEYFGMKKEAATAAYAPKCGHRDIDYLASNIVLAKLAEACE